MEEDQSLDAPSTLWSHASRVPIFKPKLPVNSEQIFLSLMEDLMKELPYNNALPANKELRDEIKLSYRRALVVRRKRLMVQLSLIKRQLRYNKTPELMMLKKMYSLGIHMTEADLSFL